MKLRGILSEQLLRDQNQEFADTAGVSAGNREKHSFPPSRIHATVSALYRASRTAVMPHSCVGWTAPALDHLRG